ncbi:hypothetical protein FALBO_4870 [Fusarium albosuccineum]|uniref:2EXR domain-containing protein n=1 Tax=Fusarium albosuccineum TaxID=1237068 RepID=A0A8H4LFT8_9HYPO|nr:hypothetical protein FALBO_4870 [Fusarium albosuccineum]
MSDIDKLKAHIEKLESEIRQLKVGHFDRFKELPIEIRHMIWGLALPDPKIITIAHDENIGLEMDILHFDLSFDGYYVKDLAVRPQVIGICNDAFSFFGDRKQLDNLSGQQPEDSYGWRMTFEAALEVHEVFRGPLPKVKTVYMRPEHRCMELEYEWPKDALRSYSTRGFAPHLPDMDDVLGRSFA